MQFVHRFTLAMGQNRVNEGIPKSSFLWIAPPKTIVKLLTHSPFHLSGPSTENLLAFSRTSTDAAGESESCTQWPWHEWLWHQEDQQIKTPVNSCSVQLQPASKLFPKNRRPTLKWLKGFARAFWPGTPWMIDLRRDMMEVKAHQRWRKIWKMLYHMAVGRNLLGTFVGDEKATWL